MKRPRASISNALLTYFVLFAVVPVGIAVTANYLGSGAAIQDNFVKSRKAVLSGVLDNVVGRLADTQKISDLVYSNQALMALLSAKNGRNPDYELVRQAMETFSQFIHYFNSDRYLLSFIIRGENGLDLRYGLYSAFLDFDAVFDSAWFQDGLSSTRPLSWPGMLPGVLTSEPSHVIPLVRPLYDVNLGRRSGTAVLLFQPRFLGNAYTVSEESSGLEFTVRGPDGVAVYFPPGHLPTPDFEGEHRSVLRDGKAFLQTRVVSPDGWTLLETVPMDFVERQRGALLAVSLVVLVGFGLFFWVLGVYVSRRITRPLARLVESVDTISRGDLGREIPVGDDEVGRLGVSIRRMQDEIKNLLEQAIRRERNLKRTEIAALQAQINPHFLSNTLNAVRIMADLQNAKGISAIVRALGGMLRGTFSRTGDTVTVDEELAVLEDYFFILRVRFKGSIRFDVHVEEGLGSCTLLRFLLQPLVENAVFHGIEPKGAGEVSIHIGQGPGTLVIEVKDDGVGMEAEQKDTLLQTAPEPGEDLSRGVRSGLGIFNIHRRIKIAHGDPYGLHYESEVGRFTVVTVTLPLTPC